MRFDMGDDAESGSDKRNSHRVCPEQVTRNPGGHKGCNEVRVDQVLDTENRQGDAKQIPAYGPWLSGQDEGCAAQGEDFGSTRPRSGIVKICRQPRSIQKQEIQEEKKSQQH